jgi:hypothetical protein
MVEVATGGPVQEPIPMLLKVPRMQFPELVGCWVLGDGWSQSVRLAGPFRSTTITTGCEGGTLESPVVIWSQPACLLSFHGHQRW